MDLYCILVICQGRLADKVLPRQISKAKRLVMASG